MKYSKAYDIWYTDKKDYDNKRKKSPRGKEQVSRKNAKYRRKNPNKHREWKTKNSDYYAEWDAKNPDYHTKYRQENPEVFRKNKLIRRYGMTVEEHQQMIAEQDNTCLRCGKPFNGTGTQREAPVVDHDHSYPKGDRNSVRGIIHSYCNMMIGHHKDNIEELKISIDYLEKYGRPEYITTLEEFYDETKLEEVSDKNTLEEFYNENKLDK